MSKPTEYAFAHGDHVNGGQSGMTLRQYYAGQALAGMCAHSGSYGLGNGPGRLAERSFELADAMIAAGEKS